MEKRLVSIILLSYKNLQYIKETIDSILVQDYPNIELIIGDDSSDNFNSKIYVDYINQNNSGNIKKIFIYSNEKNLGIVKNANKAISLSSGEYIKFIAADDVFYSKETISQMEKHMCENNSLVLTTNILWCDDQMNEKYSENKDILHSRNNLTLGNNPRIFFKKLARGCCIPAPGVMFKKNVFDKYGMFCEDYVLIEDWQTWLKLSRKGVKFDYLDIVSVKYREGVGVSTSKEPNPIFIKDKIRCIEKEILPYKKELGYWLHKNIKYTFIRSYKFKEYYLSKKILFILSNIDIISINQINKIISRLKRDNINEN